MIDVNDAASSNKLSGKSELNIKNLNTNSESRNALAISNTSTNTFDITTRDESGGFIDVSENKTTAELTSSTVTNIIDSVPL
jgi:hypothetical protein